MAPGLPSWLATLVVMALVLGLLVTVWRVSTARRTARDPGMNEHDAGTVALVSDDGLGPTDLAAGLRRPQPPAPEPTVPTAPSTPVPRAAADRLRELDELLEQGLIDVQEHAATRQAILGSL